MHYKNGREAKEGDVVVLVGSSYTPPVTGVLHSLQPSTNTCNGRLALISPNDPHVTIGECLHVDDVRAAAIPDSSEKFALCGALKGQHDEGTCDDCAEAPQEA